MFHRSTLLSGFVLAALSAPAHPAEGLDAANLERLHKQIKPQPGESRWMEIPWLIDLHEARRKAATEGKPLFVMSGGGATAIGPC